MKRIVASAVAVACIATASTALAGLAAATGINGSLHDMTVFVGANADSMGRVCIFCHTPHHAVSNMNLTNSPLGTPDTAPLWNRTDPVGPFNAYVWVTPANMRSYKSDGTIDTDFTITDPLAGPSRLCMSCHDGTIAVDAHGPAMAQRGNKLLTGRANLGQDLTQTHPIGFDYVKIKIWRNSIATNASFSPDGNIAYGTEIVDENYGFATDVTVNNTVQGVYNTVIRGGTTGGKRIKDVLFNGTIMTCASCHEVHNKENATQVPYAGGSVPNLDGAPTDSFQTAPNYFLYAKEDRSLICLSCHVK